MDGSAEIKPYFQELAQKSAGKRGIELVRFAYDNFPEQLAVLSSGGTESALLLSMIAEVDPSIKVYIIDTEKLFPETLQYIESLIDYFKLSNVEFIRPDPNEVKTEDPDSDLWQYFDKDGSKFCCTLRKVRPLERAIQQKLESLIEKKLGNFVVMINGIKGAERSKGLNMVAIDHRIDFSPLHDFTRGEVLHQFQVRGLPRHPLEEAYGYITCEVCTSKQDPTKPGEFRSNRHGGKKNYCNANLADRRVLASYNASAL